MPSWRRLKTATTPIEIILGRTAPMVRVQTHKQGDWTWEIGIRKRSARSINVASLYRQLMTDAWAPNER